MLMVHKKDVRLLRDFFFAWPSWWQNDMEAYHLPDWKRDGGGEQGTHRSCQRSIPRLVFKAKHVLMACIRYNNRHAHSALTQHAEQPIGN